jgi:NAD(P)-dependent dehydrogenase (short-subunit alcohol dehydrogenase family)
LEDLMTYQHARTVVITGAASGLGRAYAMAWAAKGFKIGILDIDMEGARETLRLVEEAGTTGEVRSCNVRDPAEVEASADHFFKLWGEVGVLVNNAGIGSGGAVGEVPIGDWEKVIETDLWGVVYGCHAFIPGMKRQGGGHIVNVSSLAGLISAPGFAPYNVSKAAVVALSQTLKTELASSDIGVTVVCPPVVKTGILDNSLRIAGEIDYDITGEIEVLRTAMEASRITPADIAARTVRAVERNRLYVIPALPLQMSWLNARLAPSLFYGLSAALERRGLLRPIYMYMARKGLI